MKLITTCITGVIFGLCTIAHAQDATPSTTQPAPAPETTTTSPKPVKTPKTPKTRALQGTFQVTQVDPQGQYVTLQNGMKYEISKRYRKYTMGWKSGDMIKVWSDKDPKNARLESVSSGKTVKATTAK